MNITSREKVLLLILLIAILIAAEYYFVFSPQIEKISELENERIDCLEKVRQAKSDIDREDSLDTEKDLLKKTISDKYMFYYPYISQEKIIVMLNDLYNRSSLKIESMNFEPVSDLAISKIENEEDKSGESSVDFGKISTLVQEYAEFSNLKIHSYFTDGKPSVYSMLVTFPFNGTYAQLMRFIKSIEGLHKAVTIESLDVSSKSDSGLGGSMSLIFLAVPWIEGDDVTYGSWPYNNAYGADDPFASMTVTDQTPGQGDDQAAGR